MTKLSKSAIMKNRAPPKKVDLNMRHYSLLTLKINIK